MKERSAVSFLIEARNHIKHARIKMRHAWQRSEAGTLICGDALDVWSLLDSAEATLGKRIRYEHNRDPNRRNIRQAEEFALKAQLAKARSVVAEVLNQRENGHSHK